MLLLLQYYPSVSVFVSELYENPSTYCFCCGMERYCFLLLYHVMLVSVSLLVSYKKHIFSLFFYCGNM